MKPGDIVQKGDILVNGFLEGLYTGTRYVHGSATIEAKTWYTKKEKQPLKQEIKVETGNEEKKYGIKFKKNQINLFKTLSKFEKYDTITNKEYKMQEKIYTEAELKAILIDKLKAELEEEIGDKTIANVNINTNQENRLCRS